MPTGFYWPLLLIPLATVSTVMAAEAGGTYETPDTSGFRYDHEWDADGNEDGIKETHFVLLKNERGDTIFTATTQARQWAWSLNTAGDDDSDLKLNYVIVDSDCNGTFDTIYSLAEEFSVPDCLQTDE